MVKFYIAVMILILINAHANAQHEHDNWYFGSQAGVSFTSGNPVALMDGQISTVEGTSAISDNAGNLLFYTDGVTVWNKFHSVMVNGTGLHGGTSSSQSALIILQPGSDSLYYIFTVGEYGSYGFQYSIVNMTLQSGAGEVILKNIPLATSVTEKLTATIHSNNTDYWIIIHDAGNNIFLSYLFSATGVNSTPVISSSGTSNFDYIGYMKVSHNGNKIALADHGDFFCELFDFDASTGIVSNSIYLNVPSTSYGPYGIEFSPNDSILYATAYIPCIIFQWDISSGSGSSINASIITIDTSSAAYIGALQLAPDGKIYVARNFSNELGVINNPNVYGTGCNYEDNGFDISPKQSQSGLPNLYPASPPPSPLPVSSFITNDNTICEKFCVTYIDSSTNNPASWLWLFPGGSPGTFLGQNPPPVCYQTPGTYDVTLITSNAYGNDTLILSNYITVYATPPFPVITQFGNTLTSSSAATYQWQLNSIDIPGATNQSYTITGTGYYTVVITDANGCVSSATLFVEATGISEVINDALVIIYPNPSNGNFMVEWPNPANTGTGGQMVDIVSIRVINALGQEIFSSEEKIMSSHLRREINLTDAAKGIYLVEIRMKDAFVIKKIIVAN